MRYLVTTYANRLPADNPIIMVDGTVPGWTPKPGDRHYDHHRPGGADIQIDEIPAGQEAIAPNTCFVTTMVDADACCAAAWVQLPAEVLTEETVNQLRAIAWDCDHLSVPESLSEYAEFAAKAVAALKQGGQSVAAELGLPQNKKEWTLEQSEAYASEAFRRGTEWLIAAAMGDRPYPGLRGEADHDWDTISKDAGWLLEMQRVRVVEKAVGGLGFCDLRGMDRSIDPRSFYQALAHLAEPSTLRPETLLLREHRLGGWQYTLGSIPLHPQQKEVDYTQTIYDRLTQAEQTHREDAHPWGGRRTVGGSAWNQPSLLSPEAVIAIVVGEDEVNE
jgi:hypothetical protein